jgi:glucose-1-phosphate thymidylyltransferase
MSSALADKAVIMARGLGTRMRREAAGAALSADQARAADRGVKALIPIGQRPFLDYVISGLADAGFDQVCLVIGPEHDELRRYYTEEAPPVRVRVAFAVQQEPRGTADAVLSARAFAGGDPFIVVNSDNYYPVDVLKAMRTLGGPGLPAFDADALVRDGNIERERVARYALLDLTPDDCLARIIEKPDAAIVAAMGPSAWVSMNCWRFSPCIFDACRRVTPSPRGELELAEAVQRAVAAGERFRVVRFHLPVLDMTSRADIADVARRLSHLDVRP